MDADDWIEPDMLGYMVRAGQGEADMVICALMGEYPDGHEKADNHLPEDQIWDRSRIELEQRRLLCKKLKDDPPMFHGTAGGKLYSREILQKYGLRFELGAIAEDGVFNLYAFEHCKKIVYTNKTLYHYRFREDSQSHGFSLGIVEMVEKCNLATCEFVRLHKCDDVIFKKVLDVCITTRFYKYLAYKYFHPQYISDKGYWKARSEVNLIRSREEYKKAFHNVDFSLLTWDQWVFVMLAKLRAWEILYLLVSIKQKRRYFV